MNRITGRYSLQITISTLFIALTLTLGIILSLQNYSRTSKIILSNTREVFSQMSNELFLDFRNTYVPGIGLLELLSISGINEADNEEQRLALIRQLALVLDSYPAAENVQIAWPDSDYLTIRRAQSSETTIAYVVEYITTGATANRELIRIFYNEDMAELSRTGTLASDYYPRGQPWYKQAKTGFSTTQPYLFFTSKRVGVTAMIKGRSPGVVLAMDITLEQLEDTISRFRITPGTEVLLINAEGKTFAYRNPERLILKADDNTEQLADMDQLGSDVLSYLSRDIKAEEQNLDFTFDERQWIGSTRVVARPGGVDLYALMVAPAEELLVEAHHLRNKSLATAAVLTLLAIPVIWLTSRRISGPIKQLAREAERVSHFDFSETPRKRSLIREVQELDNAMYLMKSTISKFHDLVYALTEEQDIDRLVNIISGETLHASQADAAITWLLDEAGNALEPTDLHLASAGTVTLPAETVTIEHTRSLFKIMHGDKPQQLDINYNNSWGMEAALDALKCNHLQCIALPLNNREDEPIGLLCLLYDSVAGHLESQLDFVTALSGFAAVALESRQLLKGRKRF